MNKWDTLQKYNLILCVVHAILAIVFIFYFRSVKSSGSEVQGIDFSLYDHVFRFDKENDTAQVFSQKVGDWGEDVIGNLIVSFFSITAGFHLLYALNPGNFYLGSVAKGRNYVRWIEYSITATMMLLIIAVLSGVKDMKNLALLVTTGVGMIGTGYWFESLGTKEKNKNHRWVAIVSGFVLLMGAFTVIASSFKQRLDEAKLAGFEVPKWLWGILISMFIFYSSFGFVPIAQQLVGGDFRRYEYVYLTLSLAAKATLGILVGFGFGQRKKVQQ